MQTRCAVTRKGLIWLNIYTPNWAVLLNQKARYRRPRFMIW